MGHARLYNGLYLMKALARAIMINVTRLPTTDRKEDKRVLHLRQKSQWQLFFKATSTVAQGRKEIKKIMQYLRNLMLKMDYSYTDFLQLTKSDMNDSVQKRLDPLVRDFEERLDFGQRKPLGDF